VWNGQCPQTAEGAAYLEDANRPEGTDGSMYHPNIQQGESLHVLDDDLLRKFQLDFEEAGNFNGQF
jgi:hypothetical protein